MILDIDFLNHRDVKKTFSFRLNNRRYTKAFREVNEKWINSRPSKLPEYNAKWFLITSEQDYIDKINQIKKHVDTIDSLGIIHIGSSNINLDITKKELNRLHEEFHRYIEDNPHPPGDSDEAKVARLCHKLNDLVHLTEGAVGNRNRKNQATRLIATSLEHMHVPYEDEDYQYKEFVRKQGTLYVGYATPGKNLLHCYQDNDKSVIEKKLVRPSQGISCELHFEISGVTNNEEVQKFDKWCEDNNVLDYGYDYRLPIHRPGWLPLGTIHNGIEAFESFIENKEAKIINLRFIDKVL